VRRGGLGRGLEALKKKEEDKKKEKENNRNKVN
jgi:hypothetical protein